MIAKYFNVSTDYLLGNTSTPTVETQDRAVCDFTGLELKTVEYLKKLKIKNDIEIKILNKFFDVETIKWIIKFIKSNTKEIAIQIKAYNESTNLNVTVDNVIPNMIKKEIRNCKIDFAEKMKIHSDKVFDEIVTIIKNNPLLPKSTIKLAKKSEFYKPIKEDFDSKTKVLFEKNNEILKTIFGGETSE